MNIETRFWKKVHRKAANKCWPWIGATISNTGRGTFYKNGRYRVAPQIAWELHYGKTFPKNLFACHKCDNPNCVNPKHIWAGTRSENSIDALKKGFGFVPVSPHKNKKRCIRGHAFTEENTRYYKNCRYCRTCHRLRSRK